MGAQPPGRGGWPSTAVYPACAPYHDSVNGDARSLPHLALTRDDLPDPRADFDDIVKFAYTFDGYAHFGMEACAQLGNDTLATYLRERTLPSDLDSLRGALYFEARRWIVLEAEPDTRARLYVGALLEQMGDVLDALHAQASPLPVV
jgi:hypothetical protein